MKTSKHSQNVYIINCSNLNIIETSSFLKKLKNYFTYVYIFTFKFNVLTNFNYITLKINRSSNKLLMVNILKYITENQ